MLKIKTLIRRIRSRAHDLEEYVYSDEDILDTINMAIRFIRRTIAEMRPSLLVTTFEGTLDAGENTIELEHKPLRVVHMTVGNQIIKSEQRDTSAQVFQNYSQVWHNPTPIYSTQQIDTYRERGLRQTELAHIVKHDSDKTGMPKEFYLVGDGTIKVFPIPNSKIKYSLMYIPDIEEVTIEDKSPFLTEYDDFIVEYAVVRLAMYDEYDVTQEQAVMSNIYQQIRSLLPAPPPGFVSKAYWS